jgi:hypothetical protein
MRSPLFVDLFYEEVGAVAGITAFLGCVHHLKSPPPQKNTTFRKLDLFPSSRERMQGLRSFRSELSNRPIRAGAPTRVRTEAVPFSEILFFIPGGCIKP